MRPTSFFDLGRGLPTDESALSRISVLTLYAAIYLKDAASAWINQSAVLALLGLGLMSGLASIILRGRIGPNGKGAVAVATAAIVAWLATAAATGTWNTSSYYIAIPCALVLMETDIRLFLRILAVHFVVSLGIEAMEYVTDQYLFVYVDSEGVELDENLFGGGLGVFRAKGLFQGPLSAVAFALWMAFLSRGLLVGAAMLMLAAFFASGRLGLSVSVLLLLVRLLVRSRKKTTSPRSLAMLAVFAVGIGALFVMSDADRLDFISSAYDLDNSQNVSRVFIWLISISHFLNFSPTQMLLGNFGFILREEGGTENDFLRMLLDNGIACLLIYATGLGRILRRSLRDGGLEPILIFGIIVVVMNIFPFIQSLSSSTLFWLYCFCLPAAVKTAAPGSVRVHLGNPA